MTVDNAADEKPMAITTPGMTTGQRASHDTVALAPSPPEGVKATAVAASPPCAADITQQGIQAAQRSLTEERAADVDAEKVSQMQALLASTHFTIDADALAASMLDYFQSRGAS